MGDAILGGTSVIKPKAYDTLFDKEGQKGRKFIYGQAGDTYDQASNLANSYVEANNSAYNNPLWDKAQGYASSVLNGDYLNKISPQVRKSLNNYSATANGNYLNGTPEFNKSLTQFRQQATRAANDSTRLSQLASKRAGMNPSLASRQSKQASLAAVRTRANNTIDQIQGQNYQLERQNQEAAKQAQAGILANNYATERGYQMQMAQVAPQLAAQRAGILQNNAMAPWGPLGSYGDLLSSSRGGQYVQGQTVRQPGVFDYVTQLFNMAAGAGGALLGSTNAGGKGGSVSGGSATDTSGSSQISTAVTNTGGSSLWG